MQKAGEFPGRKAGFLHDRVDARCIGARPGISTASERRADFPPATAWLAAATGRAVAATSCGAFSARACLPETGACVLSTVWNCGLGKKWPEPARVPLMATIPAADHTAAPATATPKEAIDSGRNRGRSD